MVKVKLPMNDFSIGELLFKEQHGREWYEERPKTKWCTNCDTFKEVTRDNACVKCDKEFFDYKLYE